MARRKRGRRGGKSRGLIGILLGTRWGRRFVGLVNVAVLGVGMIWYFQQPPSRQDEIERLVSNYLQQEKNIQLTELAFDLYQYYYGGDFVVSSFDSDDGPLFGGIPDASARKNRVRVLENEGYVCGYSETLRSPLWVSYRLFDKVDATKAGERPADFDIDGRTMAKVRSDEYTRSGYDRGHLAPNYGISRCYGRKAQLGTFLMSNVIPQKHEMNAGLWRHLEERAAVNYPGRFGEVWVVTGPIFSATPKTIGKGVPVPEACFKIMIDETEGKIRAQAFVVPQEVPSGASLNRYIVSIDEVERLTKLDFFPDLEDGVEGKIESIKASRPW